MKFFLAMFTFLVLSATGQLKAQQFVYTPTNPAFGGNVYNYSWLLSSAQAQDTTKDPEADDESTNGYSSDPAKDFAESLNRQILSRLSREIINNQFGEEGLEAGSYVLGDYQIDIGDDGSGVNITITDNTTGSTTTVEVPYF